MTMFVGFVKEAECAEYKVVKEHTIDFSIQKLKISQTVRTENVPSNGNIAQSLITEGERTLTSHFTPSITGLRTVPVIVSSGTKHIKINALLDDGSTKSYINSGIAAELGIQTVTQKVKVNVLNGNTETFETMPLSIFKARKLKWTV